ncbi:hypothetical protein B0H16DRAFT_1902929 [Mycena metata]|uniref:MACPF domain-containing protein n=1 Tax=Mycena metata TaxID=1033252 RepID=A0AAD7GLH4_9AGAR|nr:hypothetical protein B0H16DRAFT_1902929 [Mycena metata]
MSENLAIIVLLGSRREGQKLTTSISQLRAAYTGKFAHPTPQTPSIQRQIKLIAGYGHRLRFLSPHGQDSLVEIERDVNEQIKNLHGTSSNVAAILFLCNDRYADSTAYPFKLDTSFLGFSGPTLFKKLTVVPPVPGDNWGKALQDLVNEGMRILSFENRSDVLLPRILARISQGMDVVRGEIDEVYRAAAVKNKRNEGQAVILLVGETLHGKSKTINRLLGRELLPVVVGTVDGSTTKDIERVKVHNTSTETATTITVAFDDPPGFESTTRDNRTLNETLMRKYKQEYFEGTYPNVILLLVTWDSILPNADHESPHIRSVVGRSMESLRQSGLVDNTRANVVVVVTKSLSSWHEFDHLKSPKDKNSAWLDEASARRAITARLQSKILPNSAAWETVFIENGGGKDMTAKFPKLPDGNLSHGNLYHAIRRIVESPEPYGIGDLAGIQALQVLAGAQPLGPSFRTDRQSLLTPSLEGTFEKIAVTKFHPLSPDERTAKLVASYFGVTYDITHGSFGRNSVLDVRDLILRLTTPENHKKDFERLPVAAHNSERPDTERLRTHYSSDWGFKSALQPKSQCYILHHIVRVVSVDGDTFKLSADIQEEIGNLPPWSPRSRAQYMQFFTKHGTHILVKLALGGTMRVIVDSTEGGRRQNVTFFFDGAGEFAAQHIALVGEEFQSELDEQIHAKWVKELEKDPVFCPDHELTEYLPIYNFSGLTAGQKHHLQEACKVYVGRNAEQAVHQTALRALPRQSYLTGAMKTLRDSVTHAFMSTKVLHG